MSPNKCLAFGEMYLTMTSEYYFGRQYGPFKTQPVPSISPENHKMLPLGDVVFKNSTIQNGKYGMLLVGPTHASSESAHPSVKHPLKFELVIKRKWDLDLGIVTVPSPESYKLWRPVPPPGYVALGDVLTEFIFESPDTNRIWCVREDLTALGRYSESCVWSDKSVSLWDVKPTRNFDDEEQGWFPLLGGTFRAQVDSDGMPSEKLAQVLRVKLEKELDKFPLDPPKYNALDRPFQGQVFGTYRRGHVVLPYIAFVSPRDSACLQSIDNPFYRVTKEANFRCLEVWNNNGPSEQEQIVRLKMGVSKEHSKTMTKEAGVSITASAGISFMNMGASIETTANYSFSESNTTSYGEYQEREEEKRVTVPAWCISIFWAKRLCLKVMREDGKVTLAQIDTNACEAPWQTGEHLPPSGIAGFSSDDSETDKNVFCKRIPLDED